MPETRDPFEVAVAAIFESEGGEGNDPDDPGGHTNMGITEGTLEVAKTTGYVAQDATISNLTREQAKNIYKHLFWDPVGADKFPPALALVVFDAAVNQGVPTAIIMLQVVLKVRTDGVVGPKTIAAATKSSPKVRDAFLAKRALRYGELVAARPYMRKFMEGWIKRCFCVARLAGEMENA